MHVSKGEAWAAAWQGLKHLIFSHDAKRGRIQRLFSRAMGSSAADELAIGKGGTGWLGLLFLHHLPEKRRQREPAPRPPTSRAWAHLGHGRETPLGRPTCAETYMYCVCSVIAGRACCGEYSAGLTSFGGVIVEGR